MKAFWHVFCLCVMMFSLGCQAMVFRFAYLCELPEGINAPSVPLFIMVAVLTLFQMVMVASHMDMSKKG